jgi:hypothetical protein
MPVYRLTLRPVRRQLLVLVRKPVVHPLQPPRRELWNLSVMRPLTAVVDQQDSPIQQHFS